MLLATIVRMHAVTYLTSVSDDDGPFLHLIVRRRHVLHDALRHMRMATAASLLLPIRVNLSANRELMLADCEENLPVSCSQHLCNLPCLTDPADVSLSATI
jgi:hypothetical protein